MLENCDNVHVLNNILLDCTVSAFDRKTYYSHFGCGSLITNTATTSLLSIRDGLNIGTDDAYLLHLIPSGLIGALQQKLFPISECSKSLKLDFKLESNTLATIGGGTFSLSSCRIKLCLIELSDMLTDAVRRIYDGIYIIPYDSWAQYSYSISENSSGGTINISCGLKYLKGIVACFRANDLLVAGQRSLSTRTKMGLIEYRWSINGKAYPSDSPVYLVTDNELVGAGTGPADDARGFMQVMKLFNNVPSTHATCSFSLREFNSSGLVVRAGTGNADVDALGMGAFLAAVNLELPNVEEEYRTTTDSTSNNVRFIYRLNTNIGQNIYCDFYLWYSGEAVIENGVVTANF